MKEFFLRVKKSMTLPILAITLMFGVNLAAEGKLNLIGALIIGYFSALLFIFMQASRIKNIENNPKSVKLKTFLGTLLRLLFIFVVFAFAVKISVEVFALMVSGFLTFYVLFYIVSIIENLRK